MIFVNFLSYLLGNLDALWRIFVDSAGEFAYVQTDLLPRPLRCPILCCIGLLGLFSTILSGIDNRA